MLQAGHAGHLQVKDALLGKTKGIDNTVRKTKGK
jgi:hypothetical protein